MGKDKKIKVQSKSNFKDTIFWLLLIVFACIFIISGYKLYSIYSQYKQGTNTYSNIAKEAKIDNKTVNFKKLKKINPDIVGFIYSKGTVIDYPIVKGSDNEYYLHHLFDKTTNSSGTIFMDYTNSSNFNNRNTILYGHNMKNGSMFASITKYESQEYYNKHKTMKLYTPKGNYTIKLAYGRVLDAYKWDKKGFSNQNNTPSLVEYLKSNTTFTSDVNLTGNENNLITLSTCAYNFDEARYVLIGKLVKDK